MNRRYQAIAMLAPLLMLGACGKAATTTPAAPPAESVATVNGKPISKSQFDLYVANVARQAGREIPAEQQSQMLDQFIGMQLAAAEAEKAGIPKQAKVEDQLALARLNVVVDAGLQKYLEDHPVSDTELKTEYDTQIAGMPREYHARHILVDDQATAEGIIKEIKAAAISPRWRPPSPRTPPSRAAATSAGSRSTPWSSRSPTQWSRCSPAR
jgi:peptidyl-prolyl cis-trans isomerase C